MYLLYTTTPAHCVCSNIIGIARDEEQKLELIWNFVSFMREEFLYTYEEWLSWYELNTINITEQQFDTLSQLYEKYETEIENRLDQYDKFKNQMMYANFWFACFDSETIDDLVFSLEDCEIVKNIINSMS